MKYNLLKPILAGLLFVSAPLFAGISETTVPPTPQQQPVSPAQLLEQNVDKLLAFLDQEKRPEPKALAGFLNQEIAPFFDFAYMAKSAAGPLYRQMEPVQQEHMTAVIKQKFLAAMVQRLAGYKSQQLRLMSQRFGRGGNTASVTVAVMQPQGYPARLDFRFYRGKTGWKIFDVSANGQSAVIHYRREFRQLMNPSRQQYRGFNQQRPPARAH